MFFLGRSRRPARALPKVQVSVEQGLAHGIVSEVAGATRAARFRERARTEVQRRIPQLSISCAEGGCADIKHVQELPRHPACARGDLMAHPGMADMPAAVGMLSFVAKVIAIAGS